MCVCLCVCVGGGAGGVAHPLHPPSRSAPAVYGYISSKFALNKKIAIPLDKARILSLEGNH